MTETTQIRDDAKVINAAEATIQDKADGSGPDAEPKNAKSDERKVEEPSGVPMEVASPQTHIADGKLSRPKQKEEKMLHAYILKAHAQVRDSTAVASTPEDQEKAVIKYAEMVSQMTYLLGSVGIGRNTTVRALGYLNGPEQPSPAQALRQARQDRKGMNARKTNATHKDDDKPEDPVDSKPNTAAASLKTATDDSASVKTPALTGSDETNPSNGALSDKTNSEAQKLEATNDDEATTGAAKDNGGNGQKRSYRRKWWGGKSRRHAGGNSNRGADSQAINTNAKKGEEDREACKVETGAEGTPDAVVPSTAPIA